MTIIILIIRTYVYHNLYVWCEVGYTSVLRAIPMSCYSSHFSGEVIKV